MDNRLSKMKTIIFLITVTLSAALFTSCKDDDGGNESSIVGTWKDVSFSEEEFKNGVSQGIVDSGMVKDQDATTFTFNSDGKFVESFIELSETVTDSGTYTIKGNVISLTYDSNNAVEEYTFTVAGNVLTLVYTEENTDSNNDVTKYVTTTIYNRQ